MSHKRNFSISVWLKDELIPGDTLWKQEMCAIGTWEVIQHLGFRQLSIYLSIYQHAHAYRFNSQHLAPSVSNFKAAYIANYFYFHGESQSSARLMHIAHARARHEKLYVNFARLLLVVDCFALHHYFVYRKKNAFKSFFLARQGFFRALTWIIANVIFHFSLTKLGITKGTQLEGQSQKQGN